MDKVEKNTFTKRYKCIERRITTHSQISEGFESDTPADEFPKFKKVNALWDTGATSSCVSNQLASKLNLVPIGFEKIYHANGESFVPTYLINIILPSETMFYCVHVLGCDLHGIEAIIGMDIISQGDFAISNFEGNTYFSFRIPSTQKISFDK